VDEADVRGAFVRRERHDLEAPWYRSSGLPGLDDVLRGLVERDADEAKAPAVMGTHRCDGGGDLLGARRVEWGARVYCDLRRGHRTSFAPWAPQAPAARTASTVASVGVSLINACVYGCCGLDRTSSTVPCSTTSPRQSTSTRSAIDRTRARLCVTN